MYAVGMRCQAALGTLSAILLAKWEDVTTVAAPVCRHVGEGLESVRNAVVNLFLVRVGLGVALADALGDDALVAFGMASVLAVLALHTGRVLQKVTAQRTAHDIVELMLDKFVTVHLVDLFFALTDSALSAKANVDRLLVLVLLDKAYLELDLASRLQIEPTVDRTGINVTRCLRSTIWPAGLAWTALRTALSASKRRLRRTHWELRRGSGIASHFVGGHPAGAAHFRLNPLTAHLLDNIGNSNPQQTDGHGVLAGLVVYDEFDFVGLGDVNSVEFRVPAIVARGSCAGRDGVFDFDGNKGLGSSCEAASRCVIDVINSHDANREFAAQGLSEVRRIDGVI